MQSPARSSEADIIARLQRAAGTTPDHVVLGIGDDAALTHLPAGMDLVTATDGIVQGTHFLANADPRSLGHRCLASNLSDFAAMGACPAWASLFMSLPEADPDWLDAFAAGFMELAGRAGVTLIGGDTVRGPLALCVTLQGWVPAGTAVRRDGARIGDLIYVTGAPGEAAAGRLSLGATGTVDARVRRLRQRFLFPEPRLAAGQALRGIVTAMIDVSDGVHADLGRLLAASGMAGRAIVPVFTDDEPLAAAVGHTEAVRLWLHGGEDFELCFTAPVAAKSEVTAVCAQHQLPLHCIGEVVEGSGLTWLSEGQQFPVTESGFEHFPVGESCSDPI